MKEPTIEIPLSLLLLLLEDNDKVSIGFGIVQEVEKTKGEN